jgi:hypothetical protein
MSTPLVVSIPHRLGKDEAHNAEPNLGPAHCYDDRAAMEIGSCSSRASPSSQRSL